MKTKTKPKPRARRMWANYYPHCSVPDIFYSKSRAMSWKKSYPATVTIPVAVIPLDDPESVVITAIKAFVSSGFAPTDMKIVAALAAIGVLPKQRKGGRK